MKTFEVSFKYETWANYTVEAQDQAEAENIALGMLQRDEAAIYTRANGQTHILRR